MKIVFFLLLIAYCQAENDTVSAPDAFTSEAETTEPPSIKPPDAEDSTEPFEVPTVQRAPDPVEYDDAGLPIQRAVVQRGPSEPLDAEDLKEIYTEFPGVDKGFLESSLSSASDNASRLFGLSDVQTFSTSNTFKTPGSLNGAFGFARPESMRFAEDAFKWEEFSRSLVKKSAMPYSQAAASLQKVKLSPKRCSVFAERRPLVSLKNPFADPNLPSCARSKYRSLDGSCNNPAFPSRGNSSSAFIRLVDSDYADGISIPRKGSGNRELPSPRLVSTSVVGPKLNPSPTYTHLFMQFGQFMDHDLTATPSTKDRNGRDPVCCKPGGKNRECFPINIPRNDAFFSKHGETCMEFVRSLPAPSTTCTLGPRQQLNQLSPYIDASQIYGSDANKAFALREGRGGLLKVGRPSGANSRYTILPKGPDSLCKDKSRSRPCLDAGDERVNVQLGNQALHVVFMRHHNNLATELQRLNPKWKDETIYQEARAIVASQLQHIMYNEWLPVLLGRRGMSNYGLELSQGRFRGYDASVNPSIANEFATAAYRVGHTLVWTPLAHIGPGGNLLRTTKLQDTFFQSKHMYRENTADEIIGGLCQDPGKISQNGVITDLTQQLFRTTDPFGLDLVSLNIQRGRDHGLPGYMKYRAHCRLPTASSFQQLKAMNTFHAGVADRMAAVYERVEDVDLFVAGISELPIPGGVIGPTFACIISDQFRRIRAGDRFWYENDLPVSSRLTDEQLYEIKKTTLAGIICETNNLMRNTQPRVMERVSRNNAMYPCRDAPRIDLGPWRA